MNPMALMAAIGAMMGMGKGGAGAGAPGASMPPPAPIPTGSVAQGAMSAPPAGMPGASPAPAGSGLMEAMAAVAPTDVQRPAQAPATFPNQPMALNPAFAQMIMQSLNSGAGGELPGLGQLMGRM